MNISPINQNVNSMNIQTGFISNRNGDVFDEHSNNETYNYQGDTITISDDAKKLAVYNRDDNSENALQETNSDNGSGELSESAQTIQKLREQIQEIQEKIQEAQSRLIQAQASSDDDKQSSPSADDTDAALEKTLDVLTDSAEVESIRAEIEMLNQQLMMLNDQLKEAMQGNA